MQVRERRLVETFLIKEDIPNPWTRYVGRADFNALDSEPRWQIYRITREGTIWTTTYALKASFIAKWSLRTSYFPALTTSYAAFGQGMGSNFVSDTMVNSGNGISLQLAWDGNDAGNGSTKVEASVDGVCWCDYPDATDSLYTIPITPGCKQFDIPSSHFPFFRVNYSKGSNTTGTMNIAYHDPVGKKPWAVT